MENPAVTQSATAASNTRTITPQVLFEAYSFVLKQCRVFCSRNGYSEILPATDARSFEFVKEKMFWLGEPGHPELILPASHSFQKQYAAQYLGNTYTIGPCYRREPGGRLSSSLFYQIEIELVDHDLRQTQAVAIELLKWLEATFFEKYFPKRASMFGTVDSIDLMERFDESLSISEFDTWSGNLADKITDPVWLIHTPQTVAPLLNKSLKKGFSAGFDLILPDRCGEILSGGIRDKNELRAFFGGDNAIDTSFESSGFGIGLDRLMKALLQAESIEEIRVPYNQVIPGKH